MSIQKAILAMIGPVALVFAAQPTLAATKAPGSAAQPPAAAASGFKAKVTSLDDGTAKVTFQPVGSSDKVKIYNAQGSEIGELNWAASFEVSVSEKTLRKSTTKQGIDLHALLSDFGSVQIGDQTLVQAELPKTATPVVGYDGQTIPAGTEIYFGLERLAKEGTVAPVAAMGGSMGPGGAANEFNDRLYRKGVKGQPAETVVEKPATPKTAPRSSLVQNAPVHSHGVHGEPNTPVGEESDVVEGLDLPLDSNSKGFFSAPTCSIKDGRTTRITSGWGYRKPKRTTNGRYSSKIHDGTDLAVPQGTPVVAAAAGCIVMPSVNKRGQPIGSSPMTFNKHVGYGFSVKLDHENGWDTQYGHLSQISPEIMRFQKRARPGEKFCVKRGDQIGLSGMTGNCTGPHLHFGMHYNGKSVNPRQYMRAQTGEELSYSCAMLAKKNAAFETQLAAQAAPAAATGVVQSASAASGVAR